MTIQKKTLRVKMEVPSLLSRLQASDKMTGEKQDTRGLESRVWNIYTTIWANRCHQTVTVIDVNFDISRKGFGW